MAAPQRAAFSNSTNVVDEMFTEAKIDALNSKLIERGISREQIATIGDADSDVKKKALFDKVQLIVAENRPVYRASSPSEQSNSR